jgi:hypothetical protein
MTRLTYALLCLALLNAPNQGAPRPQDRVVGADSEVRIPGTTSNLARSLASIARASGVQIGFETVAEADRSWSPDDFGWSPGGQTVSDALDRLLALDNRYAWRERQGVIHVRPRAAFDDPNHFLNARLGRFELKDALPLHATFQVHRLFLDKCEIRHPIYTDERDAYLAQEPAAMRQPITMTFAGGTVLDLMDAIVRAHGSLHWSVTYQWPPDRKADASPRYRDAIFAFGDRPQVGGWWRMCVTEEDKTGALAGQTPHERLVTIRVPGP